MCALALRADNRNWRDKFVGRWQALIELHRARCYLLVPDLEASQRHYDTAAELPYGLDRHAQLLKAEALLEPETSDPSRAGSVKRRMRLLGHQQLDRQPVAQIQRWHVARVDEMSVKRRSEVGRPPLSPEEWAVMKHRKQRIDAGLPVDLA